MQFFWYVDARAGSGSVRICDWRLSTATILTARLATATAEATREPKTATALAQPHTIPRRTDSDAYAGEAKSQNERETAGTFTVCASHWHVHCSKPTWLIDVYAHLSDSEAQRMERVIYNKILIPLDGSSDSESALALASPLAESMLLSIELLHAWEMIPTPPTSEAIPGGEGASESDSEREIRAYLQRVASTIPRSVSVDFSIQEGAAADLIVEHAAQDLSTLIAMASTGMAGLKKWLVGSVADKVLQGTSNPLLLVKGNMQGSSVQRGHLERVLVPLDGSPIAEAVFPHVMAWATALALKIELFRARALPLRVVAPADQPFGARLRLGPTVTENAERYLEKQVTAFRSAGFHDVAYSIREGDAADEIIAAAGEQPSTLIAMCSHGTSGWGRWLLGSTAGRVARHAAAAVLMVRPGRREKATVG